MSRASLRTLVVPGDPPGAVPADDAQVITRCKAGDGQAFNLLVERYQQRVYALCYWMLGDADDAADTVQETFLAAYRNIRRHHGGPFAAWLLRIAANKCFGQLRARGRRPQTSLAAVDQDGAALPRHLADQSETPDERALRHELAREIQELPEDQRLVVILRDIQGYSYEEIGATTGAPLGTVKSRVSRGRTRLRDALRRRCLAGGVPS